MWCYQTKHYMQNGTRNLGSKTDICLRWLVYNRFFIQIIVVLDYLTSFFIDQTLFCDASLWMGVTWIRPVLMSVDVLSLHMIVMWFLDSIKRWTAGCTIWVSMGHRSDLNIEEVGQWIENSFNILSLFTQIVGDLCLWLYGYVCMYFERMCIDCWYGYWRCNFVTTSKSKKKKKTDFPAGNYVNVTVALVWHRTRYRISYYGFKSDLIAKLKSQLFLWA